MYESLKCKLNQMNVFFCKIYLYQKHMKTNLGMEIHLYTCIRIQPKHIRANSSVNLKICSTFSIR